MSEQLDMMISVVPNDECRIAILNTESGRLEDYFLERESTASHVGNIYRGRIKHIETSMQSAFVDIGLGHHQAAFLHYSDLHPRYFSGNLKQDVETVGKKIPRHERPKIQDSLKVGDEILVQVIKEGIGDKGPSVTSYISIPGRFLIWMPFMEQLGVTKKVEDVRTRRELRDILKKLDIPKKTGIIMRTAAVGQDVNNINRDLAYLKNLWAGIEESLKNKNGKTQELYSETDLVIRTLRDAWNPNIRRIVCDDLISARRAKSYMRLAAPDSPTEVVYYKDRIPMFHRHGIEEQVAMIHEPSVPLPSGGRLVIDHTEAMVTIDVNSGHSHIANDVEDNAYLTNLEAIDEIARQLRLRDLGGIIALDLIDMGRTGNRKRIERKFEQLLAKDRAKTRTAYISHFGVLEMTRQRMRPSLGKANRIPCKHCQERGWVANPESVSLKVMRQLAVIMQRKDVLRIELSVSSDVAFILLNRKRTSLTVLERRYEVPVLIRVSGRPDEFNIHAYSAADHQLDVTPTRNRSMFPGVSDLTYRDPDDSTLPTTPAPEFSPEELEITPIPEVDIEAINDKLAGRDREAEQKQKDKDRRKRKRKNVNETESEIAQKAAKKAADHLPDVEKDAQEPKVQNTKQEKTEDSDSNDSNSENRNKRKRRRSKKPDNRDNRQDQQNNDTDNTDNKLEDKPEPQVAAKKAPAKESKKRVSALAKEIGVKSKEIIERCKQENIDNAPKAAVSNVDGALIDKIKGWFNQGENTDSKPAKPKKTGKNKNNSDNKTEPTSEAKDATDSETKPSKAKRFFKKRNAPLPDGATPKRVYGGGSDKIRDR